MVRTRSKGSSGAETGASSNGSSEDRAPGSRWWFTVVIGLNALGFIPGTTLGEEHVSKAEYEDFWGKKNVNNGGRYRKRVSERMGKRIRFLFQSVFQRPIGANDAIPYHFGRGLLAEKKGYPDDWAGYARKMTHRGTGDTAHIPGRPAPAAGLMKGGKPFVFVSMEDLRKTTPPNKWPRNEEDSNTESAQGREDDGNINVHFGAVENGRSSSHHTGGCSTDVPDVAGPSTFCPSATTVIEGTPAAPIENEADTPPKPVMKRKRCTARRGSRLTRRQVSFATEPPAADSVTVPEIDAPVGDVSAYSDNLMGCNRRADNEPTVPEIAIAVAEVSAHSDTMTGCTLGTGNEPPLPETHPALKSVVKVEITDTLPVKTEPLEDGEPARPTNRLSATKEACREQLMRKIVTAKDTLLSKRAMLKMEKLKEEELHLCYRVWDLRRERVRDEHKMEMAVTKYFVERKGHDGNEGHHMDRELNSFRRMIEAAAKVTESYSNVRTKRGEILRLERTIKTIDHVLSVWESKFDTRVEGLLEELKKPGVTDREALQNAGYICHCTDWNCKFPLVVDDKHYMGYWGEVEQGNVVL